MLRGLRMVTVALLLLSGGGLVSADLSRHAAPATVVLAAARSKAQCHGITHGEVRGDKPTYTRKRLAAFPNSQRLCHGIWLPNPRRYLVPQGIAIRDNTAWLSGFRFREGYGERPCQLVRVDLVTGRRLAYHTAIYGKVGSRPRTYCRHGGGILQRGRWLWIVEKNKLWLVDPSARTSVLDARRVWRIREPVRGSAIVLRGGRLGLVPYQKTGHPHIYWFSMRGLLQRGMLDLSVRGNGRTRLGAYAATRIPRYTQGATTDSHARLYLTRSNLSCAELVTPFGKRMAFVPGAEGLQFAAGDRRLWSVSESGAWPYVRSRKPLTPAVSSFEFPRLMRGRRASCGFPAY